MDFFNWFNSTPKYNANSLAYLENAGYTPDFNFNNLNPTQQSNFILDAQKYYGTDQVGADNLQGLMSQINAPQNNTGGIFDWFGANADNMKGLSNAFDIGNTLANTWFSWQQLGNANKALGMMEQDQANRVAMTQAEYDAKRNYQKEMTGNTNLPDTRLG